MVLHTIQRIKISLKAINFHGKVQVSVVYLWLEVVVQPQT